MVAKKHESALPERGFCFVFLSLLSPWQIAMTDSSLIHRIYSAARTLLLDDILSAVDSHTARHIFNKALKGTLVQHRTVILVTNAVDLCLPGASFVVKMNDGNILSSGPPDLTHLELLKHQHDFPPQEDSEDSGSETILLTQAHEISGAGTDGSLKLVREEKYQEGAVSSKVYLWVP